MEPQLQDGSTVFSCDGVSVEFQAGATSRLVLHDIAFVVRKGEFLSILGRSGTGKTTLLRVLCGLLPPTGGSRVHFRGAAVTSPPDGIAIVFQNYGASLLPWRTVEKNVALGLERRVPTRERRERVLEALQLVGLHERADDYPWRLSGGMQQRVQLARALAMRPEVLLMDEPFGALDAMTKAELQDELARVQEVTGATIIFVTHDIDEAVYLSDRVLVLTGMPARVTSEVVVDLPRPRNQISTKEEPAYLKFRHMIHTAIRGTGEDDDQSG